MPNDDAQLLERPPVKPAQEKRYTLRLSPEAAETLEWIASARGGVTIAEAIRRALGTERLLLEQIEEGYSVVLEKPGKRTKELILR